MSQSQVDPALAAAENYEKNVVTYTTGPFASILLEEAGFSDMTVIARSYTIRQPRNPNLEAGIFASCVGILPKFAAMDEEERTTLAQAVEAEIGPTQQKYIEGDEELYPTTANIFLARKY